MKPLPIRRFRIDNHPENEPYPGGVCLMCCGCFRILQTSGTAIELDLSKPTEDVATFETKAQADAFAALHKWTVDDSNHRCPQCAVRIHDEPEPRKIGAYVSAAALLGSAGKRRV